MCFTAHLFATLRGWWQRRLAETIDAPPYPFTCDEWAFIRDQEVAAQVPATNRVTDAKSYVDNRGRLVGVDLEGRVSQDV